jgi:hypothetical protein
MQFVRCLMHGKCCLCGDGMQSKSEYVGTLEEGREGEGLLDLPEVCGKLVCCRRETGEERLTRESRVDLLERRIDFFSNLGSSQDDLATHED